MDNLSIFAIAAGGTLVIFFFFHLLGAFLHSAHAILAFVSKHVIYPYFLNYHHIISPWTLGGFRLSIIYITITVFFTLFKLSSIKEASCQTGTLAVINIACLIHVPYLDLQADILGFQLQTCYQIHWVIGWMVGLLATVHVAICLALKPYLTLADQGDLFLFIVCSSLYISRLILTALGCCFYVYPSPILITFVLLTFI